MQWKGPCEIMRRCGKGNNYWMDVNKKVKTFHANMLKKYIKRVGQDGAPQQNSDNNHAMSHDVCTEIIGGNEDLSVNDDEMMELDTYHQKETVQDVKLGVELTKAHYEEMINTLPRPTTKKEVQSFLGLANYYRAHIPTFAAVAAPLTDLTRKGQSNKIRWEQAQEKVFSSLRDCLLKRPNLKLPDHSKPFILRSDASNCGLLSCNSIMRDYIQ